jgi:hypothetical protein
MPEKTPESTPAAQPAGQPAQQQRTEIHLDDRQAHAAYANFARVTATPEEVIMDFALNPNPFTTGRQEIQVSQRLIMNFYTAKRLLYALHQTIQRHEQLYGAVELELARRAQPSAFMPGGNIGGRQ